MWIYSVYIACGLEKKIFSEMPSITEHLLTCDDLGIIKK